MTAATGWVDDSNYLVATFHTTSSSIGAAFKPFNGTPCIAGQLLMLDPMLCRCDLDPRL